ncbi:PTS mannitol transporter subunit IICB [Enterococcus ratti]|nr:PTS mannitol transporter subunit IICB [Enterococcus ratti]
MKRVMNSLSFSARTSCVSLRKLTHYLNAMIMPHLGIFMAWGLLSFSVRLVHYDLQQALKEICDGMSCLLLPVLISYTGGKMVGGQKGAVAGAIASLGIIVNAETPPIISAMIVGPSAGISYKYVASYCWLKFRSGYEMLVDNLLIGGIGSLFCVVGIVGVQPFVTICSQQLTHLVLLLIQKGLLPIVNSIVEPLKVLFFNNTLNHGFLTPLGIEMAESHKESILFLLEANPGPGLGILLAGAFFGEKSKKASTIGAMMIQGIGGIHEVYFPFVLMNPKLLFAVTLGGATGTFTFQYLGAGLPAPISPGSLLMILFQTPSNQLAGVSLGIFISTAITFLCAALLLIGDSVKENNKMFIKRSPVMQNTDIQQIIFACDSGMGSSAMGAAILKKRLAAEKILIVVDYCSVYKLKDRSDQLVIIHQELAELASQTAPKSEILAVTHFLEIEAYFLAIINRINKKTLSKNEKPKEELSASFGSWKRIVFLYEKNRRGAQTMGIAILSQLAKENGRRFVIQKEAVEKLVVSKEVLYIATHQLSKAYQLQKSVSNLVVVNHLVINQEYEKIVKSERRGL